EARRLDRHRAILRRLPGRSGRADALPLPGAARRLTAMADPSPRFASLASHAELESGTRFAPRFDADGLIPCVVTDAHAGGVLMFAWMNETALAATIETGVAHYWSRSRKALWKKGATSGNLQAVAEILTDREQEDRTSV